MLPTTRVLIASIFDSLHSTAPPFSFIPSNPLLTATESAKSLFVTLHCLFPTELLPALDLLDRKLVSRLVYHPTPAAWPPIEGGSENSAEARSIAVQAVEEKDRKIYYVRSAQLSRSTSRYQSIPGSAKSYEVRLDAWNCSCAAFTFSAFNGIGISVQGHGDGTDLTDRREPWFGGLMRAEDRIPVCKHLLACVLIERCGVLRESVEERTVGQEEAAGWAAGWGG